MAIIDQFQTINCGGRLVDLSEPLVMGILNVTPDSFYDGNKFSSTESIENQVAKMIEEGATFIDLGGMSSRPGAKLISVQEEKDRLFPALETITKSFPEVLISVDTWRWEIAREAVDLGAVMINDISAGKLDSELWEKLPELNVPYVLMHMQGTPRDMQKKPEYENVCQEIMDTLSEGITTLRQKGLKDIIIDPGFGFGKTIKHNYQLLKGLDNFRILGCPVMVGISRKSMIHKVLKGTAKTALNGTTAVHMISLLNGANILRVHDVKEARETIEIYKNYIYA